MSEHKVSSGTVSVVVVAVVADMVVVVVTVESIVEGVSRLVAAVHR